MDVPVDAHLQAGGPEELLAAGNHHVALLPVAPEEASLVTASAQVMGL